MSRPLKPCGTVAAYHRHLRRNESACDECRAAQAEYSAHRRAEIGPYQDRRTSTVQLPKMLLAELYLNAPVALQDRLDKELGAKRIDSLIRDFDQS